MFLTSPTYLRGFEGLKIPEYAINNMYITFFGKRMAIISIPTSVGGVSIPGSIFGGPLGSLYGKPGVEILKYPRDLENSTKSHVVLLTIKEIKEYNLDDIRRINAVNRMSKMPVDEFGLSGDINQQQNKTFVQRAVDVVDNITSVGTSAVNGVTKVVDYAKNTPIQDMATDVLVKAGEFGEDADKFVKSLPSRRTETKAFISLYMPENVSFQYDPQYDDSITLAGVAGAVPVVGRLASTVTGALEQNDALRFALNKAGYVFNPQAQTLFKGITFRTFSMNFTFTPYSKKEAEDVKKIIKLLRTHAAPKKVTSLAGMFFVPPSIFGIEFKFNGSNNSYLNKVSDCVIENIDVNYTPNGWSAHADGAPVQTTVTIQFKEIVLIDREMIEKEGY